MTSRTGQLDSMLHDCSAQVAGPTDAPAAYPPEAPSGGQAGPPSWREVDENVVVELAARLPGLGDSLGSVSEIHHPVWQIHHAFVEMWEWRRSRTNCAAHDLPPSRVGRPHSHRHSGAQRPSPARLGGGRHTYVAERLTSANGPKPASPGPPPPGGPIRGGVGGPIRGGIRGPLQGPIRGGPGGREITAKRSGGPVELHLGITPAGEGPGA